MIGSPDRYIVKAEHLPASILYGHRCAEQGGRGLSKRNNELRPNASDIGKNERSVILKFFLGRSPIA